MKKIPKQIENCSFDVQYKIEGATFGSLQESIRPYICGFVYSAMLNKVTRKIGENIVNNVQSVIHEIVFHNNGNGVFYISKKQSS